MQKRNKTEEQQRDLYERFLEKYLEASRKCGEIKKYYRIANTAVCLSFAGESLVPILTKALEHLQFHNYLGKPDLTIHIWDSVSSGLPAPQAPCSVFDFTDRGDIWGFNSKIIKTAFHWSEYSVNLFNIETQTGIYWVKDPADLDYWVKSSPLRTHFHWWMEEKGMHLLHAAAIGTDEGVVLITGKGGMGKSTTALACMVSGMNYIGDDYIIINNSPKPEAYSLYCTAKINTGDWFRFPELRSNVFERDRPDQEKDVLMLYPERSHQIRERLPVLAIMTPEIHNHKHTDIESAEFWPVQRALAFTTMSQLPGAGVYSHQYMYDLASKTPVYIIKPGNDLMALADRVLTFIQNKEFAHQQSVKSIHVEQQPLISVIVPVYNGAKFIERALQNIMSQDYPVLEIIVVDDGSTDGTRDIVIRMDKDIRYLYHDNAGPAVARNTGIKDASGEFIAFLDVDDLWPEDNLKNLLRIMQNEPEWDVVRGYGQPFIVHEDGSKEFLGFSKDSFPNYIGAALYRKAVFNKVGLFDHHLRFGEDSDWFIRAHELNIKIMRIDETTLFTHRHDSNMTKEKDMVELNVLKVFKLKLDRIRNSDKTI